MHTWHTTLFKHADAWLGPAACRHLASRHYRGDQEHPPEPLQPDAIRRLLVIRPGGMGDMIVLLPILRLLERGLPQADIRVVCERRNLDVLRLAGWQDRAMLYDTKPLAFLNALRRTACDVAIDTEQFHHFSAVFASLSGASTRIGFKINPRRNPLYTHLVNYAPDGPEGHQFLRLLEPLGLDAEVYSLAGTLDRLPDELPSAINNRLAQTFGDRPFAVIHPGASTRYKRWPSDRFAETIRQLEQDGLGSVLLGSRPEKALGDEILARLRRAGSKALSLAGDLDLRQTAMLMRRSRLFIGTDSGLAHLAISVGIPTVVLFGPSDHLKWGFRGARHAVVNRALPCAPCFIFGYHRPCRHIACMNRIEVPDVIQACRQVVSQAQ